MTPLEIRIELLKQGKKMANISKALNVTRPAVYRVIERESVSERIMISIAEAINMPKERVFPEHEFKS